MKEEIKNYSENAGKVFSQSDLNRIIGERLARDKGKSSEDLEKRESELTERELKLTAKMLLAEKKLPTELAEILKLTDEESVTKAVELLEKLISVKGEGSRLTVEKERKIPQSRKDDENYGMLRRAFGLD